MKSFLSWVDIKYLLLLIGVILALVYETYSAGATTRLREDVASSQDPAFVAANLASSDEAISSAAWENISRDPAKFTPALIGQLASSDLNQRVAAMTAINDFNIRLESDITSMLLSDEAAPVRVQALVYLGARKLPVDPVQVMDIYNAALDGHQKALVIEYGTSYLPSKEAGEFLKVALADPESEIKFAALDVAEKMKGAVGVKILIEALQETDVLAPFAVEGLKARGASALEALRTALDDPRAKIRAGAAEVIGDIGDASDVAKLYRLFSDTSYDVLEAAGLAAGKLSDDASFQVYDEIIENPSPDSIRGIAAIYAIGAGNWTAGAGRLMQIASDPGFNKNLRLAAFEALGRMKYPPAENLVLEKASDIGENDLIRRKATEAVGWFGSDKALDFLKGQLEAPDYQLKMSAATGLSRMAGLKGAVEALMLRINKESTIIVLTSIVEALGKLGDPEATPAIEMAKVKGVREDVCNAAVRRIEAAAKKAGRTDDP